MFQFSNPFKRKGPVRTVHTIDRGDDTSLYVVHYDDTCKRPGYAVELFMAFEDEQGREQVVSLPAEELQSSIALLQEAMAFVNDHAAMPRCLQTVWLRGATYYLDERLGELRRKDDPSDRIPLALS
jgi:hypothetical protein